MLDARLVADALTALGVHRLVLAIHDVSFPSEEDEDLGHGSPYSRGAERFLAFARRLGFTGIQLGPQGRTSAFDPSPYDGTLFSRNPVVLPARAFEGEGALAGLVDERTRDAVRRASPGGRADHHHAHAAVERLLDAAFIAAEYGRAPALVARQRDFERDMAAWLVPDALYVALQAEHGGKSWREWPEAELRDLFTARETDAERRDRIAPLLAPRRRAIARQAFAQMLVHEEHDRFHERARSLGLALFGDLQIGISDADTWHLRSLLLDGYLMGAPPSRTNPDGQPWGYAVLDPAQPAAIVDFFRRRMDKMFRELDGVRLDHPHGLVCPWVYRTDDPSPLHAVQTGARLFDSPDLPDHPALARFAIARPEQLRRELPRYHDGWVVDLDATQVDRYALLFDAIVGAARSLGRDADDLLCEVLSTQPFPLQCVVRRHGLGRFRVTQKANLDDPADVYRAENAAPADWIMIGNHDTPPIWRLLATWDDGRRGAWARHLTSRLHLDADAGARLAVDPGAMATAMLAELFASEARNVSVFFADLFGYEEIYNAPGTVGPENWSLRLPSTFEELFATRLRSGRALDLREALALALDARSRAGGGRGADGEGGGHEDMRALAVALRARR